ncbi:MAG: hypothetical protein JWO11_4319 [Nocardioides sp.]|nr:hypothetical protein [Nocardioides sp.]
MDEYTPDAWSDLLDDVPFDVAKAAVVRIAKRQPWVAPAEIRAEANAIWAEQQPACRAMAAVPDPAIGEIEAADAKHRGLAPLRQILAELNLRRRA